MLIKGQNAENICYQDTMKADRFKGTKIAFCAGKSAIWHRLGR